MNFTESSKDLAWGCYVKEMFLSEAEFFKLFQTKL